MDTDFLGKGAAFPLSLSHTAGVKVSHQMQKVRESILIIVGTQHGERLMRPDFGCNLKSLVYAPNNPATANLARYYVEEGLKKWEPRIDVMEINVQNDNRGARLMIQIRYRIRSTNEEDNLIYPFYLEQG